MAQTALKEVFSHLERHLLVDGFDVVMDFNKSKGARLYDGKNDRWMLDFFSFFASNPIGFNHPALSESDFENDLLTAAKVKVSNSDIYSNFLADFADYFHEHFLADFDRLFFVEGGGLGVENALKVAQDWKARKNLAAGKPEDAGEVLHFKEAFHGRTGYTLSLTNTVKDKTMYFPKFDWPRVTNPKLHFPLTDDSLAETKKLEAQAIQEIEQAFTERKDRICAILIEPIQGEGGDNFFRKEFHQQLKELSLKHEALFIYDEVQTGLGLTGKNWAHQHYDVLPDVIAFGKKVQMGGCAARLERLDEVDHVFKVSSRINSTWGGSLADMVRSRRFMQIIREEKLLEHVNQLGEKVLSWIQSIEENDERVTNARGLGLWIAFDLPDGNTRNAMIKKCWENGLMILPCGTNSIRLRPVLNITEEEAQEGLSLIKKSLKEI